MVKSLEALSVGNVKKVHMALRNWCKDHFANGSCVHSLNLMGVELFSVNTPSCERIVQNCG